MNTLKTFPASSDAVKPFRAQVSIPVMIREAEGNLYQNKQMRVTHTPFKTKTRAIGSDLEMTLALIGALRNPRQSKLSKLGKLAGTITKLLK